MIDSWQQKQILKLYIYFVVKTTSSVELFEGTHRNFKMAEMTSLHMYLFTNFVYNCVFRKDEKSLTKPVTKNSYLLYFLMTEGFQTFYFITILSTDILSSRTKTEGLDF